MIRSLAAVLLLLAVFQTTARSEAEPMTFHGDFSVTRTGDRTVTMRRTFQASRMDVFDAMTTPALLREWLSAAGRELTVCEVDLREGGSYHYVFEIQGTTFGMSGTYREVVPGERIVNTESYDGYDWEPLVVTTRFTDVSSGTQLEVVVEYPSKEICDRDAPNLEQAGSTYDNLAELLRVRAQRE